MRNHVHPLAVLMALIALALSLQQTVAFAQSSAATADETLYEKVGELTAQGKTDEALALVNTAIAAGGSATAYALRCEIYTTDQKYDAAKPDCAKALQLDSSLPLAHQAQGDLLYDSGDIQASLKEYDAYISMLPSAGYGYWRRCDARRRTGDWAGAQADCDKAFAMHPDDANIRLSRGRIELQNKDYQKAYADFDFAVPRLQSSVPLYWRGYAALQLKRYDQAVADFSAAIKLGDDSPDTYHYRSDAYLALGKKDLAKADWETMIAQYRKYGECDTANGMAMLGTAIFGGNNVTVVACN
jgi:tetratricopeptide (TPR) repeat protein